MKKRFFLYILATIIIFFIIFSRIPLQSVILEISQASLFWFGVEIIILFSTFVINSWRWQYIGRVTFKSALKMIMVAYTFSSFTPSKLGDFVKVYYLKKDMTIRKGIGLVMIERIFDAVALGFFLLLSIVVVKQLIPGSSYIYFLITLIILGILILFSLLDSKIINRLFSFLPNCFQKAAKPVLDELLSFRKSRRRVATTFLLSIFSWFVQLVQIYVIFLMVDAGAPFLHVLGLTPIAIMIGYIPITVGGMGTRDSAFIVLFAGIVSPEKMVSIGILFTFFRYILPAVLGLLWLDKGFTRKSIETIKA